MGIGAVRAVWLGSTLGLVTAFLMFAPAARSADQYWAFGDSITNAVNLDPDYAATCTPAIYPAKCGYQGRLQDNLGKTVFNRGVPGEKTPDGLSRIDDPGEPLNANRCDDPNAGDVLALMEGSNNNNISAATIQSNLQAMMDLAATKCVHSLIASIIRRLAPWAGIGSTIGAPNHTKTTDVASAIGQVATASNRTLVGVWDVLCDDPEWPAAQPCFNTHYWGKFISGDPGHVDSSGYNIMEPLFRNAITAHPVAGAATNLSPSSNITDTTPTFSWDEHTDSDWYFLDVNSLSSHGWWYPEEAICSGGTCTVTPAGVLAAGHHDWRVRTRNLQGVGAWTPTQPFSTCAETNLVVANSTPPPFIACDTLSTAASGFNVSNGEDVTFSAGTKIVLDNGFTVETGGSFEGRVDY